MFIVYGLGFAVRIDVVCASSPSFCGPGRVRFSKASPLKHVEVIMAMIAYWPLASSHKLASPLLGSPLRRQVVVVNGEPLQCARSFCCNLSAHVTLEHCNCSHIPVTM